MLGEGLHAQLHVRRQFARHDPVAKTGRNAGGQCRPFLAGLRG